MELAVSTRYAAADLARPDLPTHVLRGGEVEATIAAAGTASVTFDGLDLTRWRGDRVEEADGFFLYLRDLDTGHVWSAGHQPVGSAADAYEVRFGPGTVELVREDDGIETRLCLAVAPEGALVGRLRLRSLDGRPRRVEATTFAEVVLHDRAADAAHPAFSKLFVETERVEGRPALVARRRPRSPEDAPAWLAHWLDGGDEGVSWETDRLRFVGRGRSRRSPAALDAAGPLAGTTGAVLDPVVALRTVAEVPVEGVAEIAFGLAGGRSREAVVERSRLFETAGGVDGALEAAQRAAPDAPAGDGRQPGGSSVPLAPLGPLAAPPAGGGLDLDASPLLQWNGIGGFSADGTEYVLHLHPDESGRLALPPLPWTNVIANERGGFVVSERGAASTWAANSRENRLTPWSNDPVEDAGEALYLHDGESGAVWSPTPGPVPASVPYEVRHGFGYTAWRVRVDGIEHETVTSIAPDAAVRLTTVRLTNTGDAPRRLAVVSAARLVLGPDGADGVVTERDGDTLFARNGARDEFAERVAFAAVAAPPDADVSLTAGRAAFLGRFGTPTAPLALAEGGALDGETGPGLDLAAHRVALDLEPGETVTLAFALGEGKDRPEAEALAQRFRQPGAAEGAIDQTKAFWRETTTALTIETPEPALDLLVNGWLVYQNLSCRLWGRTAFYQSGGAYGFRDQLQDTSALVWARPDLTRAQVLRHAAHQFPEGDVLHWWHPPTGKGIRTRFADDLVWLPLLAAQYVAATGDAAVLEEHVPFVTARPLAEGEDEAFVRPERTEETATVYEHAARALDRSLDVGAHGLPLMGVGDWNDGMNRVGREGRGESVWMGFFLIQTLGDFLPHVEARGDEARAERYREHRQRLLRAVNEAGWDGAWYRRAFYDSGAAMGSAESDECQIDALAQAWAVLSGAAPPDRARQSLDALDERLIDEEAGLIRLLDPPFDRTPHDPGYIKGYVPGVRENGGQYTHAALWAVRAFAEAGRCERAAPLLAMLSPVSHTSSPEAVAVYKTEPYAVAADVYGVAPHVGRGGWTWYTGSAGWMLRVAVESVLGLGLDGGEALTLAPCIPSDWPGFSVRYRLPDGSGTVYKVRVERGDTPGLTLDGEPLAEAAGGWRVPLVRDGAEHAVRLAVP